MSKFHINEYKSNFVMHCKTEEEARDFCNFLHSVGRKWVNNHSYLEHTCYNVHYFDTVYFFNEGTYSHIDTVKQSNYTILEWSDYMEKKFTKADLKTGDVIKHRNGKVAIVNKELETFILTDGWNDFDDFNNDLTEHDHSEWDIMEVRRPDEKGDCRFTAFNWNCGTLVYERPIVEEMTLAEVCKALGKEIKIVKE